MIRYEGQLYRPPSEARSLILQATIGCSYNECSFCGMYRDKRFRVRPLDELKDEIAWAASAMGAEAVSKVFLADGDALVAKATTPMELVPDPDLMRPVDLEVLRGDNTKLRAATGWQPEIDIDTTLLDLLEYWRHESRQSG